MLGARVSARPKLAAGAFGSPERAELGLAIAERVTAEEHLARLEGANNQLREAYYAADEAAAVAADALEVAKTAASQHVLASAIGEAGEAPQTVRAARAALLEAQDALDAAKAACDGLASRIEAARAASAYAAGQVKVAAQKVLLQSPAVAEVSERLLRAHRDLCDADAAFEWLIAAGAFPRHQEHGNDFGKPADPALRHAVARRYQPPCYWHDLRRTVPGAGPWEAALQALQVDANAPLPGEPA